MGRQPPVSQPSPHGGEKKRGEKKKRRGCRGIAPSVPCLFQGPTHSFIVNSAPWQHIVFPSRQERVLCCELPTVCFLSGRVYSCRSGESKGTKTPVAGARAYVQTRRHRRTEARVAAEPPGGAAGKAGMHFACPPRAECACRPSRRAPGSPGSQRGSGSTSHSCSCAEGSAWLLATGSGYRESNTE